MCISSSSFCPYTLFEKSNFCPKIQFWQILTLRHIWIFPPKLFNFEFKIFIQSGFKKSKVFPRIDFFGQKMEIWNNVALTILFHSLSLSSTSLCTVSQKKLNQTFCQTIFHACYSFIHINPKFVVAEIHTSTYPIKCWFMELVLQERINEFQS